MGWLDKIRDVITPDVDVEVKPQQIIKEKVTEVPYAIAAPPAPKAETGTGFESLIGELKEQGFLGPQRGLASMASEDVVSEYARDPAGMRALQSETDAFVKTQEAALKPIEDTIEQLEGGGEWGGDQDAFLKALMVASDGLTGTKFSQAYKAVGLGSGGSSISPIQRKMKAAQLTRQLSSEKAKLARMKQQAKKLGGYIGLKQKNLYRTQGKDIWGDVKEMVYKPVNALKLDLLNLDTVWSRPGGPSYQQVQMTLGKAARSLSGEVGVLTNQDIQRIMPLNIWNLIKAGESFFGKTPTADMPAEFTRAMREVSIAVKAGSSGHYISMINDLEKMYKANPAYKEFFELGGGDQIFEVARKRAETLFPITDEERATLERIREGDPVKNETKWEYISRLSGVPLKSKKKLLEYTVKGGSKSERLRKLRERAKKLGR